MNYISICSGIEAATVAWKPLGWKALAFAEIEPFPNALLQYYYPDVPNLGDISTVDWRKFRGAVDLVVGGTPCQSFSVAGTRKGMDGSSGLVREYFRLLSECKPRWFLWENVPGVLSSSSEGGGQSDFSFIMSQWHELGYNVSFRILDAQYFGVPQRRRRIFALGCLAGWQYPAKVLFEWYGLQGYPAPSRKTRKADPGQAEKGIGGTGRTVATAESRPDECVFRESGYADFADGVGTLKASGGQIGGGSETLVASTLTAKKGYRLDVSDTYVLDDQGGQQMSVKKDVIGTLRAEAHGHEPLIFRNGDFSRYIEDDVAGPIKARDYKDASDLVTTAFKLRQGKEGGGKGYLGSEEKAFTLSTHQDQQIWCLAGNIIDRQIQNGGNGAGFQEDVSYTLNTVDRHAVCGTLNASGAGTSRPAGQGNELDFCIPVDTQNAIGRGKNHTLGIGKESDPQYTLSASHEHGIIIPNAVRRLTPLECERLQAFPDNYTNIPFRGKPASDGVRYKALGNSMCVNVMRWIGQRIQMVEDEIKMRDRDRVGR
jgi:DNA (cytosine-5)-methyltransferase 1